MFAEADYHRVHAEMICQLAAEGATIDAAYFCPAAPAADGCEEHPDRKPSPGMLLRAAADLGLDLSRSWTIGDKSRDIEAGRRAGCRGIPVGRDIDFAAAVDAILDTQETQG